MRNLPSDIFCSISHCCNTRSSAVIDYITRNPLPIAGDIGIAYIYCCSKDQDGQTPVKTFASILRQLASQKPKLPSEVITLNMHFNKPGRTPALKDVLKATVSLAARFSSVFIFFDGLDEYDERTRPELVQQIKALMATNIRGFVTSRANDSWIQSVFEEVVTIELSTHAEDIEILVRSRLSTQSLEAALVESIVSRVLEKAAGVYVHQPLEFLNKL